MGLLVLTPVPPLKPHLAGEDTGSGDRVGGDNGPVEVDLDSGVRALITWLAKRI